MNSAARASHRALAPAPPFVQRLLVFNGPFFIHSGLCSKFSLEELVTMGRVLAWEDQEGFPGEAALGQDQMRQASC